MKDFLVNFSYQVLKHFYYPVMNKVEMVQVMQVPCVNYLQKGMMMLLSSLLAHLQSEQGIGCLEQ